MSYPYDQSFFGDNYYSFESNGSNGSYSERSRTRPQIRPDSQLKSPMNYSPNQSYANNRPVVENNNYYRRTQQQPFYGPNRGSFGGQYRAQVIDYSNGNQMQTNNNPMTGMPSNASQPMTRPQTGLLPTPQSPYQGGRPFRPRTPNSSLFPIGNQSSGQRFGYPRPQQTNSYGQPNQSIHNSTSYPQTPQNTYQTTPQPVPPPVPTQPAPPPPPPTQVVVKQEPNRTEPQSQSDTQWQRKVEESRIKTILGEGMERRAQNELNGFFCLFCEVFCNNVNAAERHVESPKHQRTKIGDTLKGIDAKFTIKSERITETAVALARKEELTKISNVIKNEYFNEGIRLKDGIGPDAYICENCGLSIDSLVAVKQHLELHKQFTEQLKVCSKPIIGLDFIVEYRDPDPNKLNVYECSMCRAYYSTRDIISHVCSFAHRTSFIRKIHPSEGAKYTVETAQLSLDAGKRALELETLVGRGHFKVKHQSAPQNCLMKIAFNYPTSETPTPMAVPVQAVNPLPAIPRIELPKHKSENEKTELEKLFCVELGSEGEANEVTKILSLLTDSMMEYHMKGLTPDDRERFSRHLKGNEQSFMNH